MSKIQDLVEQLNLFKLNAHWTETLSITSKMPAIEDANDDIKREAAFLQLALQNTIKLRRAILAQKIKFTRPDDFFAEMLKTDAHMEKVREKLLEEAKGLKNSEDAKRKRQAKKFGKVVQQQKIIERQATKSDELEKIKMARKKHANTDKGDEFGIEVEQEARDAKRKRGDDRIAQNKRQRPDKPTARQNKDDKYGFGGAKRNIKSNDRKSTDNLDKFSVKKMKSGSKLGKKKTSAPRPGKDKRSSSRGKQ